MGARLLSMCAKTDAEAQMQEHKRRNGCLAWGYDNRAKQDNVHRSAFLLEIADKNSYRDVLTNIAR